MADKEVRELIDAIQSGRHGPSGIQVVTEGKHAKLLFQGQTVHERLESGEMGAPLTLPTTPSDARWYPNTVQRLIRSRVLTEDPKKVGQRGLSPQQEEEREVERERRDERREEREEEVAATAEEAKAKQANTTILRQRAQRLFEPMGIWKPTGMGHSGWRGTIAEVARVSFHWAQDSPDAVKGWSEERYKTAWRRLLRDEPLDAKGRAFLNAFVDHLDRSENASRVYNDLLRRLLGIRETRAPAPARARDGGGPQHVEGEEEEAGTPVPSVKEVVDLVEKSGGLVTSAEISEALVGMNPRTRTWATWKAVEMGLIQRLGRGRYAPLGYEAQPGEESPAEEEDVEEAPPGPEEDIEALADEAERGYEPTDVEEVPPEMERQQLEDAVAPLIERLDALAEDVQQIRGARATSGAGPPTLALECLAEMIGQHITVGGGEDGGITDEVLSLIDTKRTRALELAKRVAELEAAAG